MNELLVVVRSAVFAPPLGTVRSSRRVAIISEPSILSLLSLAVNSPHKRSWYPHKLSKHHTCIHDNLEPRLFFVFLFSPCVRNSQNTRSSTCATFCEGCGLSFFSCGFGRRQTLFGAI